MRVFIVVCLIVYLQSWNNGGVYAHDEEIEEIEDKVDELTQLVNEINDRQVQMAAGIKVLIEAMSDRMLEDWSGEPAQNAACDGNVCKWCFKIWKLEACFVLTFENNSIIFAFTLNGKTVLSKTITVNGSYTLTISKSNFPYLMRKLMKSDLIIEFTKIDIQKKSLCIQGKVEFIFTGWVRFPPLAPWCPHL